MSSFIWKSSKAADDDGKGYMHIQRHNAAGVGLNRSLCARRGFDRSINMPFALGMPVCATCEKRFAAIALEDA